MSSRRETRSSKRFTQSQLQEHARLIRAGITVNHQGLPALPTEMLLEISSHYAIFDVTRVSDHRMLPAKYLEYRAALKALSQTCKSLRSVFLPILWQRIEACASPVLSAETTSRSELRMTQPARESLQRYITKALLEQMETVTVRNPALAQQVRIFHAIILDLSYETTLPAIAECMKQLPNLQTVYFVGHDLQKFGSMCSLVSRTFREFTYPSVRNVVLFDQCNPMLYSFPDARCINWNHYFPKSGPRWRNLQTLHISSKISCKPILDSKQSRSRCLSS
ncbi:hypothetical protein C8J56DRAFT_67920 [Mycena floridula]|nr:hypothetical protein C8J56DRAFT_67920 [Mycena floridula]